MEDKSPTRALEDCGIYAARCGDHRDTEKVRSHIRNGAAEQVERGPDPPLTCPLPTRAEVIHEQRRSR